MIAPSAALTDQIEHLVLLADRHYDRCKACRNGDNCDRWIWAWQRVVDAERHAVTDCFRCADDASACETLARLAVPS